MASGMVAPTTAPIPSPTAAQRSAVLTIMIPAIPASRVECMVVIALHENEVSRATHVRRVAGPARRYGGPPGAREGSGGAIFGDPARTVGGGWPSGPSSPAPPN